MSGIVVGVDTTETAHRAAVKAARLATAMGEPLHLVMAMKEGRSQKIEFGADRFFDDWLTTGESFLRDLRNELGVHDTTTAIGGHDPAKSLCEEARRIDASVIVVGNKRVQGAKRVLGSIATDVTRHAHCDVLVAHTSDEPSSGDLPRHSIATATLFETCSAKELEEIDRLGTSISVPAGQALTQEGRTGREFGVLLDGSATVTIGGDVVATLNAGDHFGEMALLEAIGSDHSASRLATITTDTDLWISVMSLAEFSSLVSRFPEVAERLREGAARRSRANEGHTST